MLARHAQFSMMLDIGKTMASCGQSLANPIAQNNTLYIVTVIVYVCP